MLAQDGRLDVEAPVAEYWPEFAANGKAGHPGRLPPLAPGRSGLDRRRDDRRRGAGLGPRHRGAREAEAPNWEPGTKHGYHATTYGWLVGEVIRRVAEKSVGTDLQEMASPTRSASTVDRPARVRGGSCRARSSRMIPPGRTADLRARRSRPGRRADGRVHRARHPPRARRSSLPGVRSPTRTSGTPARCARPRYRRPTASATPARWPGCTRRCISEVDGIRLLTPEQVKAATTQRTAGAEHHPDGHRHPVRPRLHAPPGVIALGGPSSFGHFGAGGSVGWADPDAELAFGYIMNRMDIGMAGDVRSLNLINACYDAIG